MKSESSVTIEKLSVQFDVEGEGQERVFASLFSRYIDEYMRLEKERKERSRATAAARSLGDQQGGDF